VTKSSVYRPGNTVKDGTCTLMLNDSCAAQDRVAYRTTALGVADGGKWVVDKVEED